MRHPYRTTLKPTINRYEAKTAGESNLFQVVQYLLDIIDHSGVTTPRYENEFQFIVRKAVAITFSFLGLFTQDQLKETCMQLSS